MRESFTSVDAERGQTKPSRDRKGETYESRACWWSNATGRASRVAAQRWFNISKETRQ